MGQGTTVKRVQGGRGPIHSLYSPQFLPVLGLHVELENPGRPHAAVLRVRGWQSHLSGWCRSSAPWRNDPSAELLHTLNPRSFSPSQDGGAGSGARGGAHPVSARPSSHSSAPPFAARRPAPSPGPARYSNPECVFLQMIKSIQS